MLPPSERFGRAGFRGSGEIHATIRNIMNIIHPPATTNRNKMTVTVCNKTELKRTNTPPMSNRNIYNKLITNHNTKTKSDFFHTTQKPATKRNQTEPRRTGLPNTRAFLPLGEIEGLSRAGQTYHQTELMRTKLPLIFPYLLTY